MKNYSIYRLSGREIVVVFLSSFFLAAIISWLFYRSFWGMSILPLILLLWIPMRKRELLKKQKSKLTQEFLDFLHTVSMAMLAGFSIENAFVEGEKELALLHGPKSIMLGEVQGMNASIRLNEPVELLLSDFANRSGVEEIIHFSEVLAYAKRCGGDLVAIMGDSVAQMREKQEVEQEISVTIASRCFEQKIMNIIPLFILAYLQIGSGDYLAPLYGNPLGIAVMTGALVVYGLSIMWSQKIMDIQI